MGDPLIHIVKYAFIDTECRHHSVTAGVCRLILTPP